MRTDLAACNLITKNAKKQMKESCLKAKNYLFTSESVSEGHPDKVSDQISDAILDNMLAQDPQAHVACETLCTTGQVVIAGEVSCNGWVDIQRVVRKTIAAGEVNLSSLVRANGLYRVVVRDGNSKFVAKYAKVK